MFVDYLMPKQRSQATTLNSASAGNTASRHRDTLSKHNSSSDNEDVIPIPIQIFLWRQSKLVLWILKNHQLSIYPIFLVHLSNKNLVI